MTDPRACLECEGRCWVPVDLTDRSDVLSHTGFTKCPDCAGTGVEQDVDGAIDAILAMGEAYRERDQQSGADRG